MNVGELLRERDRLLGILAEAKSAKARLKQLNVLIAMYGDDDKVALNGDVPKALSAVHVSTTPNRPVVCAKCGETFKGIQGVATHNRIRHGGKYKLADKVDADG
jgi:hypothetical protein